MLEPTFLRMQIRKAVFSFAMTVGLFAHGVSCAQADSLDLLFDDSAVREYTITFYDDTWESTLEQNWIADSGYVAARFSDGKLTLDSVGVRYKGNSSYSAIGASPKKPFKIKLNEFRKGQAYYGENVLNFSNGYGDPTFLREKIAYDISRKYLPTPRANFATITIGSTLIGLYTQVEQPDNSFLTRWYGVSGYSLYKAGDNGFGLAYAGDDLSLYEDKIELKTNEDTEDWNGILKFMAYLDQASDSAFCRTYQNFMDMRNVAKFLAFNMVLSHFDSYTGSGRNYYMVELLDQGYMSFVPWDMNLAFGGYSNGWNVYTQSSIKIGNLSARPLMRKVLACKPFRNEYLAWIREMVENDASTESVQESIDRLAPMLRDFVDADPHKFYRIGAFDTNLTTKYRASATELIPGLIEFSTSRNAFLLKEVVDSLEPGYVLPTQSFRVSPPLSIHMVGGQWYLRGVESLGEYRVDFRRVNGGVQGGFLAHGSQGSLRLDVPYGLVLVQVRATGQQKNFLIQNLKRSGE